MKYKNLFSSITMRGVTFPNRVMRTAMVSRLATEDGFVTEMIKERYKREAKGGTGAIVVEAAVVLPSSSSHNLRISDDRFVSGLAEVVTTMHEANPEVKVGLQIMHFLKIARSGWRQKVEDFKKEELPIIVNQHVEGAKRALSAGFDFIELHNAHAFTLSSFLSRVNKRTDEYGGSFENRMRLPIEVYQAVRKVVGDDYSLGMRMNGEDFIIQGNTLAQSTRIARRFAELGVDYISVSAGDRFEDSAIPEKGNPPDPNTGYSGFRLSPWWWWPDGAQVYLGEEIRKAIREAGFQTPVAIAGKIREPKHAEEILEQGKADIIGLCRALLCDADWTVKAREGRDKDIVRCAACNWCLEADMRFEKVNCVRWPEGSLNTPDPFLPSMARAGHIKKEDV